MVQRIKTLVANLLISYIFSQGYSSYFFLIFAHLWWFGVSGLGSYIGFSGWGFRLMGFGACGMGPSGFFGLGLSI